MKKAEPDGFLGRWSRRKLERQQGRPLDDEPEPRAPALPPAVAAPPAAPANPDPPAATPAQPAPALTLADTQSLTPASDFKPFMASEVAPEVRNAAMKKLFADPHFNVMDRLDTYIDDYSLPDPIPESMLRQMVSAKFLNLFPEQPPEPDPAGPRDAADGMARADLSQSEAAAPDATPSTTSPPPPAIEVQDAHADLRLQPDHAAQAPGTGRGAE